MQGLDVAQRYFNEWGLPYFRAAFPQLAERVAAFVLGGSQSLGNDDALSRDHGFTLVLTGEDMRRFGKRLRTALDRDAPREWLGQRWRSPARNIEVYSVDGWFRQMIGCTQPPQTRQGWHRRTSEDYLYMLRHATIFHDPLGAFTARRQAFWFYPRAVWLQRLEQETFRAWHYGQYNFLDRLTSRRDPVATAVCLGHFMEATMRLCLLLAGDYTPYWKWLPAEFRKLPNVSQLAQGLSALAGCQDLARQIELVEAICQDLHTRLVEEGLVSAHPTGHPHPLFCAKQELGALRGRAP